MLLLSILVTVVCLIFWVETVLDVLWGGHGPLLALPSSSTRVAISGHAFVVAAGAFAIAVLWQVSRVLRRVPADAVASRHHQGRAHLDSDFPN